MKKSIVDEIKALRKTDSFSIDNTNINRYMLVLLEDDGSRTAYCFSTPIYNINTGKMVKLCFHKNKDTYLLEGSNACLLYTSIFYNTLRRKGTGYNFV